MILEFPEIDFEQTRRAFDSASGVYDTAYEGLPGIRRFRSQTRALYLSHFPAGGTLLDLNCGTGSDAIFLGHSGFRILATDISGGMLAQTRDKILREHLDERIETAQIPFHELPSLKGRLFDGGYSNMGGLNCTNQIGSVARALAALIRPGGTFIATVMPSFCLWETLSSLGRLQWKSAFRRSSPEGTIAKVHGGAVHTFYYSPRKFRALFTPFFDEVLTVGLGILIPPPNHTRAYKVLGKTIRFLEWLDELVSSYPPFPSMGDHFVMVLRRNSR